MRIADLTLPDLAATEPWLEAAQRWMATVDLPRLRYRLQQRWGHLRLLQGESAAAQRHLQQAIDEIERLRSTLVQERLRVSFLDDKSAAYQDLVQLHLLGGDTESLEAAFEVSERAKSRALVDLIAGAIQPSFGESDDDELAAQLQLYQSELNAIYNEMLSGGSDAGRRADAATLKVRAAELEQAMSHLRLRQMLGQGDPPPPMISPLFSPEPLLPNPGTPAVPEDTALLVYHIVGDEILAFVWADGSVHGLRHLTTATEMQYLLQRLAAQWARFRTNQSFIDRHQRQMEQSVQRLLQMAYTLLMAPVEALLQELAPYEEPSVRKLVIVPHRFLHQLPFHALHDGERYLVERCAISYAPSATVFTLCQQRTLCPHGMALAVAAPDLHIPAAALEAEQVAQRLCPRFAEVRLLLNEQATLSSVTTLAPQCSHLHLACHGLFRRDNPMFSAIKLHDGWLTALNVAHLQMRSALVTLSACESGRSQVMGGDENIGLVYAFLSAGAATLLVSQWLVQDEVTARLMDHWYAELVTATDLAVALRTAQLDILAQYPHPYYWAPFVLIGQRSTEINPYEAL